MNNKVFFCYAVDEYQHASNIKNKLATENVEIDILIDGNTTDQESHFSNIDEAEVVIVLVSESSHNNELVKTCIKHTNDLNKRILPVIYGKKEMFSSTSWLENEWGVNIKPFFFLDADQCNEFISTLKEWLGMPLDRDIYPLRKRLNELNTRVAELEAKKKEGKTLKFTSFLKLSLHTIKTSILTIGGAALAVGGAALSGGCITIVIALVIIGLLIEYPKVGITVIVILVIVFLIWIGKSTYDKYIEIVNNDYEQLLKDLKNYTAERDRVSSSLATKEKAMQECLANLR